MDPHNLKKLIFVSIIDIFKLINFKTLIV